MGDFHRCIDIVLAEEGGHANHPRDPGGLTNYGIASKSYPNIDIARLTETQAKEIYRRDYWERISGDDLPTGLDLVMLDTAVNMGAVRAIMILQEALGVTLDGTIGEATRARIRQTLPGLINEVCALRAWRYEINRNEDVFGKGWFRRLFRVHALALDWSRTP